jgi:hypothetical protein
MNTDESVSMNTNDEASGLFLQWSVVFASHSTDNESLLNQISLPDREENLGRVRVPMDVSMTE